MVRVREGLMKGLPAAGGLVAGVFLVTLFAAGATGAAGASGAAKAAPQDPAVAMQIQQALNNFRIQQQSRLTMMQTRLDTMEREVRTMRFQLDTGTANRSASATPIPADPIPGVTTWGRLVSESSTSERFVLNAATGRILGHIGMTSDGPGLVLYDAAGHISAALVATPTGPELRMVDADGVLQTVLPQQQ